MRHLILLLLLACALPARAQDTTNTLRWTPGGGIGLSLQGPAAFELHANYVRVWGSTPDRGPLYQLGPELAVSVAAGTPAFWSQRFGIRQFFGTSGWWAVSLTAGLENHSRVLSLDDTRTFLQSGINLFGLLSLEYAMTWPMSDAPALPDRERVLIRLDLNVALIDRMFRRVPFSIS
jgi:hypothetical protein